jgi:hypothetical protein
MPRQKWPARWCGRLGGALRYSYSRFLDNRDTRYTLGAIARKYERVSTYTAIGL